MGKNGTSIWFTQHMNLEENLPREGELWEEEHTSIHKGDRYEKRVLTVPLAPEDSGAGGICHQGTVLHNKGVGGSTHDCKVNSREQPGV